MDDNRKMTEELKDANACMTLGAGIGAFGAGTTMLIGATCPLCIVFAPALIGIGAWKRYSAKKGHRAETLRNGNDDPVEK